MEKPNEKLDHLRRLRENRFLHGSFQYFRESSHGSPVNDSDPSRRHCPTDPSVASMEVLEISMEVAGSGESFMEAASMEIVEDFTIFWKLEPKTMEAPMEAAYYVEVAKASMDVVEASNESFHASFHRKIH